MAMVLSENIKVFPCVSRTYTSDNGSEVLDAKLLSEKNITNIVKSVTDNSSFILSYNANTITFILEGYYFEIKGFTASGNKYAQLIMNGDILHGDGGTEQFTGIEIKDTKPSSGKYLTLCESGVIPASSYQKFSGQSFGKTIDCGELK